MPKRLDSSGGFRKSYYIGGSDNYDGNADDDVSAGDCVPEDFSREAAVDVVPLVSFPETDIARAGELTTGQDSCNNYGFFWDDGGNSGELPIVLSLATCIGFFDKDAAECRAQGFGEATDAHVCLAEGSLCSAADNSYACNMVESLPEPNSHACNIVDSLPEHNSYACSSVFEDSVNPDACSTVIEESFNSKLLHICSHSAFLKAIF